MTPELLSTSELSSELLQFSSLREAVRKLFTHTEIPRRFTEENPKIKKKLDLGVGGVDNLHDRRDNDG
jgi:hypothetical protein